MDLLGLLLTLTTLPNLLLKPNLFLKLATICWLGAGGAPRGLAAAAIVAAPHDSS
jgi:hypothetical protein